ncbi:MAG: tol-pal system protein YbgF [Gemmatimonadota bacterium]
MLNLVPSRFRGSGRESGPRIRGGRWLLLAFLGLSISGCATKRDLRDLRSEIQALAEQQREALNQIEGLNLAVQDTLRGQSDALFESRGETLRLLRQMEQQLITLRELTGQNQRALTTLRDLLESGRASAMPPTVRTDPPGQGQVLDPDFEPEPQPPPSEAAVETYNAAVRAFNRGNIGSARRAFNEFLQRYPNDPLAPDAHFYLADLLVQEDRLEEGISAFLRIPELYPTAEKVPDALYRVGVIYMTMEEDEDARQYFERVVSSYPDSGAAILAQERLDEIS